MGIVREINWETDLQEALAKRQLQTPLIQADNEAHKVQVAVKDGGEAADLTGCSCIGYFLRADGETVAISGSGLAGVDGSTAWVVLPVSCYAVPGRGGLIIRLINGDVRSTVLTMECSVYQSTTGQIIDPGQVVPDLDELLAQIERMEEATEAAEEAAEAVDQRIAPLESMDKTDVAYTYGQNGRGVYYSKNDTLISSISRIVGPVDVSKYGKLYYSRRKNANSGSNAGMHFLDADGNYISGERDIVDGVSENAYEMAWLDVPANAKTARFTAFSDVETFGDFVLYGVSKIVEAVTELVANDAVQDTAISALETNDAVQDAQIAELDAKISAIPCIFVDENGKFYVNMESE